MTGRSEIHVLPEIMAHGPIVVLGVGPGTLSYHGGCSPEILSSAMGIGRIGQVVVSVMRGNHWGGSHPCM